MSPLHHRNHGWWASTTIRQARALRELRPLWEAFTSLSRCEGRVRVRLCRRVVEIQDGMLSLTSVATPDERRTPRCRDLDRVLVGAGPLRPGVPSGVIPGPDFAGDIEKETAWLRQVAVAYRRVGGTGSRVG
ncbi:DUF6545 domain-containing protein [Herbidospora sp. NBRC 101105]|uniref:DUF6545 domain-containing protein n=1 Tax=Herbidospora sp. NBRC 101105 TaxID=3032195 RepID=UPI00333CCF5C